VDFRHHHPSNKGCNLSDRNRLCYQIIPVVQRVCLAAESSDRTWEGGSMAKRIALFAAVGLGVLSMAAARAEGPDIITVRQTAFDLNGASFAYIRSVVKAKGDVKQLEAPGKAIARWATVIPTMFPAGTEKGGNTKALSEIWSDSAGFKKDADALHEAAVKLTDAAKAGDATAVADASEAMGKACGACHRAFRAK
jgi:cytochrome c556